MFKDRIEIIKDKQKQFYDFEDDIIKQVSEFKLLFDILSNNNECLNSKTVYDILDIIYKRLIDLNGNFVYLSGLVSEELGRFEAETQSAASLIHPNIVNVCDADEDTEDIDTKDNTAD